MNNEDRALVVRLQQKEEAAFRELVEKYKKMAYYLAMDLLGNEMDAEDASQEAFMKVYTSINQFRGESRLSSWFYRIVVNTCLNRTRRKSYSAEQSFGNNVPEEANTETINTEVHSNPEQNAASSLMQQHIQLALNRLSDKQKTIFVLRYYHDLPIQEISNIVNCSVGTVKSQLFRTIRKLQKSLAFYRSELGIE